MDQATLIYLTEQNLDVSLDALCTQEEAFRRACNLSAPIELRSRPDGFTALLSAIVSQQLSVAAAGSIWSKLEAKQATSPEGLCALDDETLRACGLSRPKVRYARALASSNLDFTQLRRQSDEEVIKALTAIPGIGRWSAEIYLMVSLGRGDVMAAGDLALQEAARLLFDLPKRPSEKELRQMAESWSPYRSLAALVLWAYYRAVKSREGIR